MRGSNYAVVGCGNTFRRANRKGYKTRSGGANKAEAATIRIVRPMSCRLRTCTVVAQPIKISAFGAVAVK
jgi:hypothetical protein